MDGNLRLEGTYDDSGDAVNTIDRPGRDRGSPVPKNGWKSAKTRKRSPRSRTRLYVPTQRNTLLTIAQGIACKPFT